MRTIIIKNLIDNHKFSPINNWEDKHSFLATLIISLLIIFNWRSLLVLGTFISLYLILF